MGVNGEDHVAVAQLSSREMPAEKAADIDTALRE